MKLYAVIYHNYDINYLVGVFDNYEEAVEVSQLADAQISEIELNKLAFDEHYDYTHSLYYGGGFNDPHLSEAEREKQREHLRKQ